MTKTQNVKDVYYVHERAVTKVHKGNFVHSWSGLLTGWRSNKQHQNNKRQN